MSSWVSTKSGRHLKGRKQTDTAPELALRRGLHAAGFRFRLRRSLGRGCNPDLVLPKYRLAVWVDGCFWHGHESHSPLPTSGPNVELWRAKRIANRARDARAVAVAEELGWACLRVWECQIRENLPSVIDEVRAVARRAAP